MLCLVVSPFSSASDTQHNHDCEGRRPWWIKNTKSPVPNIISLESSHASEMCEEKAAHYLRVSINVIVRFQLLLATRTDHKQSVYETRC
jgi:hypothetical protein